MNFYYFYEIRLQANLSVFIFLNVLFALVILDTLKNLTCFIVYYNLCVTKNMCDILLLTKLLLNTIKSIVNKLTLKKEKKRICCWKRPS